MYDVINTVVTTIKISFFLQGYSLMNVLWAYIIVNITHIALMKKVGTHVSAILDTRKMMGMPALVCCLQHFCMHVYMYVCMHGLIKAELV